MFYIYNKLLKWEGIFYLAMHKSSNCLQLMLCYMHIYGLYHIRHFETIYTGIWWCLHVTSNTVNRRVLLAFILTVNLTPLLYQQRNASLSRLPVTFQSWHGCVWTRTLRVAVVVMSRIALRRQLQDVNSLWYNIPLYYISIFFYLRGN